MSMLFAEDFPVGRTFDLGSYSVTAAEIKAFAGDWDPLPFHVDERAAAESPFGGLVASGAHTLAICIRLASDAVISRAAVIAGRGIGEARFLRPIRPEMVLTGTMTIVDQRMDGRARGEIHLRNELRDQDGELVMSMLGEVLVRRRESAPAGRTA
jgi:acyl dehydratase